MLTAPQFVLPRLPASHPQRPNPKAATTTDASSSSLTITLKPLKPSSPTVPLSNIDPAKTSIYDLKSSYSTSASIPATKIKILYKKKPVTDSKTVADVIGNEPGQHVEFGVMVMAGATVGGTPVTSPPAAAPTEVEKGLADPEQQGGGTVPAAQGPSGKDVVNDDFWEDLRGFVVQRIRDEKEGERLVHVFKGAWEEHR
jgi:hypothetical protein